MNDLFAFEQLRPMPDADMAMEQSLANFDEQLSQSILPEFVRLARDNGVRFVGVRVKRRPGPDGVTPETPAVQQYVRDLRAWLESEGGALIDDTDDAAAYIPRISVFLAVLFVQLGLARFMFGVDLDGVWLSTVVVFSLGYVAVAGIGFMIASITNTVAEAQVYNQISFFALLFLSGIAVPLSGLPSLLRGLAAFVPSSLMVVAATTVLKTRSSFLVPWPEPFLWLFLGERVGRARAAFMIVIALGAIRIELG